MNREANPNEPGKSSSEISDEELVEMLDNLVGGARGENSAAHGKLTSFASRTERCPDIGEWVQFAAGDFSEARRDALLAHAAICSSCLARFQEARRAFSGEASAEEFEEFKRLNSASAQWQHRLAVELAHSRCFKKHTFFVPSIVWQSAGLAAAVVLAIGGALWWQHVNSPERLLAQAYTGARSFDLRMPGAGFAPVTPPAHVRGEGMDREPASLLSARAQIEHKLDKSPSDPHWLQLEARAQMLSERYDSAIDILDRLVAAGPVTPGILLDDGSAYFMRGVATGSENDRATALDDLRRADELAPDDPIVLFNEALMMEDRGQIINAVETWNRYLKFERDPKWQEEGRHRLAALEEKLNRLKTHESRMEQHLATPQSMRALAADSAALAGVDEEFSTSLLPRLLDAAFPIPVDRSRGSPCGENCMAARSLLDALAASLLHNHQDHWLKEFLPSQSSSLNGDYFSAAHALGQAIDAGMRGDYVAAVKASVESADLFRELGNTAGADRAVVERVYAEQRSFTFARCQHDAATLLAHRNQYMWIRAQATSLAAGCDVHSGMASMDNPLYAEAFRLAKTYHYLLLELRARNGLAGWAVQYGDNEDAWRLLLEAIHCFYARDSPPFRAGTFMAGLVMAEKDTPRVHLAVLLNREALGLFELARNAAFADGVREQLIVAALRAGSLNEAREQIEIVQQESQGLPEQSSPRGFHEENELALADLYLDRRELTDAGAQLDAAKDNLAGDDNWMPRANYARERGELELALGHPEIAESTLRNAILHQEFLGRGAGPAYIVSAHQDRDLYAALAGVWMAEHRPAMEILALWERYRLRILGLPVPACSRQALDCLAPKLSQALGKMGQDRLVGQIVLRDRVLLYRANAQGVEWSQTSIERQDALAVARSLDRVASSPATSQVSIDQSARRAGTVFVGDVPASSDPSSRLILEPDPMLGNLPWSCVEIATGVIGLQFNLEEAPSILLDDDLLDDDSVGHVATRRSATGKPLIVGASIGAGATQLLPEALDEARIVAETDPRANLLLGHQATESEVTEYLATAPVIHFAGHAAMQDGTMRLLLAPANTPGDKPYIDAAWFRAHPPRAAQIAVFSACSTGKGQDGWNHGMGDIVETLASLGVQQVVATRWQIDSASAVPIMDTFYHGLAKGMSVPQALTAARQSLFRDARHRHPYYWAAYYASGVGTTDLREVFHGANE